MRKSSVFLSVMLWGIISVKSILAAELGTGWGTIDVHGFISQGFLKSDHTNFYVNTDDGTFQFNEFGINFATEVTDRLRTGIQFFSRDLGEIGNNAIEIDWAYGDYRWKDWLGFRAGKIKVLYGFYNETRDVDMLRTSIFLPSSIYNESFRDNYQATLGLSLYGNLDLKSLGSLTYQVQGGELTIPLDGGMARYIEDQSAELDLVRANRRDFLNSAIEWNTPLDGLELGGGIMTFEVDLMFQTTANTSWARAQGVPVGTLFSYKLKNAEIRTLSGEYTYKNLVLAAEYVKFQADDIGAEGKGRRRSEEGYYGSAAYRFTDWFELGAYYSMYYPDTSDRKGRRYETMGKPHYKAWQKEFVLTTRFDINDHWTLKLEGHVVNGAALFLFQDNPDGLKENSFLFAAKTTFNF